MQNPVSTENMPKAPRPSAQKNPEYKMEEEALQHKVRMLELERKRQQILQRGSTGKIVQETASAFPMKTAALMLIVAAVAYKLGPERLKTLLTQDVSANVSSAMVTVKMHIPSMEKLYSMTHWPIFKSPPDIGQDDAEAGTMSMEESAEHAARAINEHGWWAIFKCPFRWALAFCAYSPLALGGVSMAAALAVLTRMNLDLSGSTVANRPLPVSEAFKDVVRNFWPNT